MSITRTDRVAGALLGVHAGDALGATFEFSSAAEIRARYPDGLREIVGGGPFDWPAGHATDDTDLTRAILLAYLDPGDDMVRTAAGHMLDWLDGRWPDRTPGQQPRDIGGATLSGLTAYRQSRDPRSSGAGAGHAGNGSLMRCIPTALAVAERDRRLRESAELSAITHDDPWCTSSCAVYNELAAALVHGEPAADAVAAGLAAAVELGPAEVVESVEYGMRLPLAGAAAGGQLYLRADGAGLVLDSLTLAVAAALDPRPLPDVLVDVVRIGHDTDSNAAIAGGLLGARDGVGAIPAAWRATLQFGDEFSAAADRLG